MKDGDDDDDEDDDEEESERKKFDLNGVDPTSKFGREALQQMQD